MSGENPSKTGYVVLAGWVVAFGIFLMAGPDWFSGPSWSYFARHGEPIVPAGAFGMGTCLTVIGVLQLIALWRDAWQFLPTLFFLSGFVFMTSGLLLGAEGLLGHQGLQEAPAYIYMAVHKFVVGAELERRQRQ